MNLPGIYNIFQKEWEGCQDIFLISDTHFNDQELYVGTQQIIRANTEDYIKLINSKVGKKSGLIHLGDVGDIAVISQIKAGYKMLVAGNHDSGLTNYKRQIIKEKFDANKYNRKEIINLMKNKYSNYQIQISDRLYDTQQAPFEYYIAIADNKLFDSVFSGPVQIGEKLILSHERLECSWAFNIHGHIHSFTHKDDARHMCICPEVTRQFEPINFNQLMKSGFMSKIETQHRKTINSATKRSRKRGKKK